MIIKTFKNIKFKIFPEQYEFKIDLEIDGKEIKDLNELNEDQEKIWTYVLSRVSVCYNNRNYTLDTIEKRIRNISFYKRCKICRKKYNILKFYMRPSQKYNCESYCIKCSNLKKCRKAKYCQTSHRWYLRRKPHSSESCCGWQIKNRKTYREYQNSYHSNYLLDRKNRIAHSARTQINSVVRRFKKQTISENCTEKTKSFLQNINFFLRNVDEKFWNDLHIDHVIPLSHLTKFLIDVKKVKDKKKIIRILNSEPNLSMSVSERNRRKYDMITDAAIDAAVHLEDFYLECSGLKVYLQQIREEQAAWGCSISRQKKEKKND